MVQPIVRGIAIAFVAMTSVSQLAMAQNIQSPGQAATGPYVDADSGLTFLAKASAFERFRLTRGPGPKDMSAGYLVRNPTARLSAIILSELHSSGGTGHDLCQAMSDAERTQIQKQNSDAKFSELAAPSIPGYSVVAFSSHYATSASGQGANENFYICKEGDGRMIEYSFRHASEFDASVLEADLIDNIKPPAP